MADRVGQQLGNYRLIRLLGRGGFAEVYLGEHLHLNTLSAIKVLRTQLADDDVKSFLTEARTIARLEHPHIVRIFDFEVEGRYGFSRHELCGGRDPSATSSQNFSSPAQNHCLLCQTNC